MPYRLSDLVVIGERRVHPEALRAEAESAEIASEWGVARSGDYGTMTAYLFPDAPFDRLVTITLLNDLLFYLDDAHERHAGRALEDATFATYLAAFVHGVTPADPDRVHRAAVAVRQRLLDGMAPSSFARFSASLERHLRAALGARESTGRGGGRIDLERYLDDRVKDSGMEIVLDLAEYGGDFSLSDDARSATAPLRADAAAIGALLNDLFSYPKEVLAHGSRYNLVAVLEQDFPRDEAVARAITIVNGYSEGFLAKERSLPVFADDRARGSAARYVMALRQQTSAAWYWQLSTPRYRSDEALFPELRSSATR